MPEISAADLLAFAPHQARVLFPGTADDVAARFRDLARAWHPDRNPAHDAGAVFARIVALHEAAKRSIAGTPPREAIYHTVDGRAFRLAWRARRASEMGEALVGDRHVAHAVPADLDDLAAEADAFRPRFADAAMEAEVARMLPRRVSTLQTAHGRVFVERKDAGQVLLRDLMRLGPVPPRHAAWIATRLVNLACWLQWAGIAHGAIGPDTLLVDPASHSVALTGPFLCAGPFGTPPAVLPERTLACAPRYAVRGALRDERLDPDLVRLTLREALGDAAGTRLATDPGFPKPFAAWLMVPPAEGARSDFPAWERARDASFGPRRFVRWDVDTAALMAASEGGT